MKNSKFEIRNLKQYRGAPLRGNTNSNVQMVKTFGILNFFHLNLFRISPAEDGSDRIPALLGDIRISHALLLLCCCPLMYLMPGCANGNKTSSLVEEIQQLKQEKTQLQKQFEQSKAENEQLKKQVHVLSGLPEQVKGENLYRLQKIEITRYTNLYDKDKDGKNEKLIVYIQPFDEHGDVIKATGAVEVQLWDLNKENGEALLGQWSIEPEQLKKLWFATLITINYRLIFDVADKIDDFEEPLTVKVTFTDYLTGTVFKEQRVIKPHPD